ncbi:fatty acyl-AMP ligase [Streptomyces hiroshimensis]|uniref:AMP-binding protein n=1 Tax=Streptomyces hiroshimensis TaxID=66424 RepID=A0ABQ2Z8Q8_9ACTN|nr:fatty acyl-AMP ligase [Streptomyces hiroshimensis]GGY05676.1 AMP-binding protein [Streptomyces hiroshimensis]
MTPHQETFTERVLQRAAERGGQDAFVHLRDTGTALEPERLGWAALDHRAKDIASWLQERGLAGRQVLLLEPPGPQFITAFTGCLYAGAVAVPAPLPAGRERHFGRLSRIAADARISAVLTSAEHAPEIAAWLAAAGFPDVACLATDAGPAGDPAHWRAPRLRPDDLAFLQYTSGSTSAPKGVMVSHGNLMANEAAVQRALGSTAESCLGSWLPVYHDMGLIGHVLHPLWLGARAALMSPETFLRRPAAWLEMITAYGVTHGGGPNFAYDMCVRRVREAELARLDLSTWQQACNGAEPVRADTLRAFTERFAPAGFRREAFFPCYGMAEATLLVSGTPLGTAPVTRAVDTAALEQGRLAAPEQGRPTRTLAGSGRVHPGDFEIRIVDPATRHALPEGGIGEIWLRGPSIARGYWGRPDLTAEAFGAALAGPDEESTGWLRTGDLGALDDGELYVTGRLKEMLIVNGRNIYPHDVEAVVRSADPALGTGAAFAVASPYDGRDRLVVVQELRDGTHAHDELLARVRRAVSGEFGVAPDTVLLVAPGTVHRTTSGKIQRTLMRDRYLAGELT